MSDHTPTGFTEGPDFEVLNIPPTRTGFTEHVDYTVLAPPAWAPPAPPAPKKSRPWMVPAIGLTVALVLAAGIGTAIAATGDPPARATPPVTTPGGCYGDSPGDKFVCRNGKWLYSSAAGTPATTPRTTPTTVADTDYVLVVIDGLIDDLWAKDGAGPDLCDSLNEVVASGLSRHTALQLAHNQWASEDYGYAEYQDYIVAALDAKTAAC